MSEAYKNAINTKTEESEHLFRVFLFMTAHVLLHELGHVLITYLTKGDEEMTPPTIHALSDNVPGSHGEAGRALECLIYGGTVHYFHEPESGTPDGEVRLGFHALVDSQPPSILCMLIDVHTSAAQFT